eukprot:COSAG02_NODE_1035_length_15053_cov_60.180019_8_plen_165_part_00
MVTLVRTSGTPWHTVRLAERRDPHNIATPSRFTTPRVTLHHALRLSVAPQHPTSAATSQGFGLTNDLHASLTRTIQPYGSAALVRWTPLGPTRTLEPLCGTWAGLEPHQRQYTRQPRCARRFAPVCARAPHGRHRTAHASQPVRHPVPRWRRLSPLAPPCHCQA